jgi:plastocyanin
MKLLITLGIAAGAVMTGTEAKEASTNPAPVSGRVLFTGPMPTAGGSSVKYDGKAPESKPLVIEAAKSEGCSHGDNTVDQTDRSLMIGKDGGLANVVVIVDVDSEAKPSDEPVLMDQKGCRFEPHVTVVQAGATVKWLNSDTISHNVHTYAAKNDTFNQIIAAGSSHEQKLDKADRIEIKCDIHPWMNSFLVVADSPFFAVTDATGNFTLPKLPAGTHKLEYWHEKLGKNKGEVTVGADGVAEAVTLKWGASEKKSGRRRR